MNMEERIKCKAMTAATYCKNVEWDLAQKPSNPQRTNYSSNNPIHKSRFEFDNLQQRNTSSCLQ